MERIMNVLLSNLVDIALVLVGSLALVIYFLQERRKEIEAASLIVMQIEALQKQLREIASYIVDGKLIEGAFYESKLLYKADYWEQYRHYFVRKMDALSLDMFDEFYNCASEVLEQQQFMKNLQKNSMFMIQQMIMQMETNLLMQDFSLCLKNPIDEEALIAALKDSLPQNMKEEQKVALEKTLMGMVDVNVNVDYEKLWAVYNAQKNNIHSVINQNALTAYTPVQIRITLENALKKHNSIRIFGCDGFRKLKKIAARKF